MQPAVHRPDKLRLYQMGYYVKQFCSEICVHGSHWRGIYRSTFQIMVQKACCALRIHQTGLKNYCFPSCPFVFPMHLGLWYIVLTGGLKDPFPSCSSEDGLRAVAGMSHVNRYFWAQVIFGVSWTGLHVMMSRWAPFRLCLNKAIEPSREWPNPNNEVTGLRVLLSAKSGTWGHRGQQALKWMVPFSGWEWR